MEEQLKKQDIKDLDSIGAMLIFMKGVIMQHLEQGTLYNEKNNKFREEQKMNLLNAAEKIIKVAEKL